MSNMPESLKTLIELMANELDAAGYATVPKEPTPEMISGLWAATEQEKKPYRDAYHAMLSAAPWVAA